MQNEGKSIHESEAGMKGGHITPEGFLNIDPGSDRYPFSNPYTHESSSYKRNIVNDVAIDNLNTAKSVRAHAEIKRHGFNGALFHKFLPKEFVTALRSALAQVPEGHYYYTQPIGKRENGTTHPHTFIIESRPENTNLFFLDPENTVARRNWYRPDTTNLIAMRVPKGDEAPPDLAILRHTNKNIPLDKLNIRGQYQAAKELLTHEGMTETLSRLPEQLLYRLVITANERVLQSVYSNEDQAIKYVNGEPANKLLQAKEDAYRHLISQFLRFLYEGRYKQAVNLFGPES